MSLPPSIADFSFSLYEGSLADLSKSFFASDQTAINGHTKLISSGQPKGLYFGFGPKFSVSVGGETFRQDLAFRPKENFGRKS